MAFAVTKGHVHTPLELNLLRAKAQDLAKAADWAGVYALRDDLRGDTAMWTDWWSPTCAVAAFYVGDPAALALLEEAIAAGFCQPEILEDEFAETFGVGPDWPRLLDLMAQQRTEPPVRIVAWPTITPAAPLALFRLPQAREAELRTMIPAPAATAWETAKRLLGWVSSHWKHANSHMVQDDAVACLEQVAAGERFACVEYSLVLSQALNALGIPARRLSLAQKGYHAGVGRGHVVSEAWIDDLNQWVVLDGQNGLYWTDVDGRPLGLVELMELRQADGAAIPVFCAEPLPEAKVKLWWSYFDYGFTNAGTIVTDGLVPIFQRGRVPRAERLETEPGRIYPDLSELAVGVDVVDNVLAVRFTAAHPFATGFVVDGEPVAETWTVDSTPGEHVVEVAARTAYGVLAGHQLRYHVTV